MIDLDLFVIGTGPAGQRAAIQAAKLGKRVGICDRREVVGGVCVNTGTIPSKTFREALLYLTGYRQRAIYGDSYRLKEDLDMQDLLFRCQHVIQQQIHVIRQQMRRNGVMLLSGTASFRSPYEVEVRGHREVTQVRSKHFVIATGTEPAPPPDVAVDGATVITADEILSLESLPRSMTVVGAGVIGLEYASMFGALDTEVTIIDKRRRPLEFVDSEIIDSLLYQMRNRNCVFRLGEEMESIRLLNGGAEARLKSGKRIQSEVLFYSIGRVGATASLNLKAAGLESDGRGRIPVGVTFQTRQHHIYAVGDVIGFRPSLPPPWSKGAWPPATRSTCPANRSRNFFPTESIRFRKCPWSGTPRKI